MWNITSYTIDLCNLSVSRSMSQALTIPEILSLPAVGFGRPNRKQHWQLHFKQQGQVPGKVLNFQCSPPPPTPALLFQALSSPSSAFFPFLSFSVSVLYFLFNSIAYEESRFSWEIYPQNRRVHVSSCCSASPSTQGAASARMDGWHTSTLLCHSEVSVAPVQAGKSSPPPSYLARTP